MAEFEKVIKGLEYEINSAAYYGYSFKDCVSVSLLRDALSLLKAQEPAAPLEPLAEFIVENLDPRVDCKTCATIREGWEDRECANCPKMSEEEVLDALKKWMEEQDDR